MTTVSREDLEAEVWRRVTAMRACTAAGKCTFCTAAVGGILTAAAIYAEYLADQRIRAMDPAEMTRLAEGHQRLAEAAAEAFPKKETSQ